MKSKLTETPFVSMTMVVVVFALLAIVNLADGLQTYLELGGGDYISSFSLLLLVFSTLGVPALGSIWLKLNFGWLLMYISIPLGLFWSLNEAMTLLSDMEDPGDVAMTVPNILLPAFFGGLFCLLAFFILPNEELSDLTADNVPLENIIVIMAIPTAAGAALYISGAWWPGVFLDARQPMILLCCITLASLKIRLSEDRNYGQFTRDDWGKVFLDGGKVTTFLGAGYAAVFYIAFSRIGDPVIIGPVLFGGYVTILFGLLAYVFGTLISINVGDEERHRCLRLDMWHLVEAYGFVLLATLGPASLFDMGS